MGDANNNPKPSIRPQIHYFTGKGYAIVDGDGVQISGYYGGRDRAKTRLSHILAEADRKAKRGPRPCMCCGTSFESEGIHNRLCARCRSRDAGDEPVRPYIARSRKAA